MNKIVIANWKMHLTLQAATELCNSYKPYEGLIVAPPSCYMALLNAQHPQLQLAAQCISYMAAEEGAYTGEVSAKMYASCGVRYAIVGHSERRSNFGINNPIVTKAIRNAIASDITPIICIGERREGSDMRESIKFLLGQIDQLLMQDITHSFMIAYEPVWAIGTGVQPQKDRLTRIFEALHDELNKRYHELAKNIRLVYGGSVNSENASEILGIDSIDGVLVGGSSLDAKTMNDIISQAESV